jgi:hypothetical protein
MKKNKDISMKKIMIIMIMATSISFISYDSAKADPVSAFATEVTVGVAINKIDPVLNDYSEKSLCNRRT